MVAGSPIRVWNGTSRRRVPRFQLQAPLDVTVLRSGIPDTVPGRSVDVCERGIAGMLAGELVPGENVGVEVQLSSEIEPLRARATVRYQDRLRCGLEFVDITADQRSVIRDWAKEMDTTKRRNPAVSTVDIRHAGVRKERGSGGGGGFSNQPNGGGRAGWIVILVIAVLAGALCWWKWNRSWEELESGSKRSDTNSSKPVPVSADVLQKLLIHKVDPQYPSAARKDNLQGIIAIDVIVGQDGSVQSMRALNGPDVLARAAMDALRWWKFEPYRINGEPVTAESTLGLEFKP